MAELILRIFFNSLAGRALSSLFDEIGLTRGVQSEFNDLVNSLSFIRGYLQDAEKRRVDEEALKVWLKQLQDLAYEADDLLDDFNTEIIRRRSVAGGNKKMVNEVSIFFSSSNQFIYANRMAHRITDLKKKVDALSEGRERFHLKMISENLSLEECHHKRPLTVSSDYERYVIGRDEDKNDVINFLLNPNFDENLSILSIVGFGGTGKTTLARLVYKDERLKDHFPLKIWVCVSTNFVVEDILRNLIRECSPESRKDKIAHLQMNDLHDKLREELGEKMFLIVLDDVWNEDRNKWLELENHIPYGAKGSKMLVTTRSSLVANIMVKTSHKSHNLSGLPEEESLTLLMKMAGKEEDEWKNKNLEKIAKGILKKCGGFPLAIMTIGRLLSTRVEAKWSDLLEEDFSRIEQKEGDIMPTLKISYDFLPSHLKQCFAYCCLFPKDYELDPNELVRLWMAQGFILKSSTTSRKTLHDVGKEYFMELASRSFFQDLERDQLGNIKGCKMHDLMHDLATMVACGSCTTIVKDGSGAGYEDIPKEVRHVSMVVDMGSYNLKSLESLGRDILSFRNYSFDMDVDMGADMGVDRGSYNLKSLEPNQRIIRSLLFINQYQDINSFGGDISSFRNLRALRLHRLAKAEGDVLRSIGKLKHLRSLDLSWSRELTSLPNSIGKLLNLETLILYRCQNLESLPREVTKLINLRHLNVKGCGSLTHMPRGIGNLTNLEELSLFRVGKTGKWNGARMDELRGLTGLREELTIDHLWGLEESDSILTCDADSTAYYLIDKSRLKRLHLSWERWYWGRGADDPSEYAEEVLERLKPNLDLLKSLTIYYYPGTTLPSWTSLLHNLVEIEIEDCNNIRSIPPLDQLSWLESIKLSDCNNIRSIPPLDQLSSLESIKLRNCNNIRSIPPLDQLSSLESISLYDCNNIRSIPPLDQLPSLKSIWFDVLQELEWIEVTENSICLYPSLEEVSLRNLPMFKGWKRKRMEVNRSGDQSIHSSSSSSPPLFFIPSFSKNSRQVNDQLFRCEMLSYMWDNNQELILSGMKYKDLEEEMWRRNRRNLEEEEEEEEEEEVMVTQMGSLKILPLSSVPLHLLTSLSLHYLEDTEHLPMELFQSLSRLQSLKITKCHHIRSIPPLDQLSSLESIKLKYLRKLEWIEVTENSICLYPSLEKIDLLNLPMFKGWKRMEVNRSGDQTIHSSSTFFISSFSRKVNSRIDGCEMLSCMRDDNEELLLQLMSIKYKDLEELWRRNRRNVEEEEEEEEEEESCSISTTQMGSLRLLPLSSVPLHRVTSLDLKCLEDTEELPMELFQFLSRLRFLNITDCHRLKSLPGWWILRYLRSLEYLRIDNCKELDLSSMDQEEDNKAIQGIPNSQTNMRYLKLIGMDKMKTLPGWIQYLPKLRSLELQDCKNMETLPGWFSQLNWLNWLYVIECGELSRRCQSDTGECWPQISHIEYVVEDVVGYRGGAKVIRGEYWPQIRESAGLRSLT